MPDNFKYYKNNKCEYFPCHKVEDTEHFNCLFCFCPLYMLKENCGGNFKFRKGVKDCSGCTLPHSKNSHEYIMSKMEYVVAMVSEQEEVV